MTNSRRYKNQTMNITSLDNLAEIVSTIDENKSISGVIFVALTNLGMQLIANMKQAQMDVGILQYLFAELQKRRNQLELLPELIDRTHDEIIHLLGDDVSRVYGCEYE
ncbi:MAG: hypothetical protein WC009_11960 [Methylotenera sp.]